MANIHMSEIQLTAEDMNQVQGGYAINKSTPVLMFGSTDTTTRIGSATGGGGAGKVKFDR